MNTDYNSISIFKNIIETPLFSALSTKEAEEILTYLEILEYKKADIIFEQDGSPNSIYLILDGAVDLIRKKEKSHFKIKSFSNGDCFGETDLLGILPNVASAVVIKDSTILKLSKSSFHKLSKNNLTLFNKFLFNITREICRRLHNVDLFLTEILDENNNLKNNHWNKKK